MMNKTLSEKLQGRGLWPFEAYVRDFLTMAPEDLARRMARRGIKLEGYTPQGVVVAMSSVRRPDGTQLDGKAVLAALMETGVYVLDWALNRARVIPLKELTFTGWSQYDEESDTSLPEVPFTRTNLLVKVRASAETSVMDVSCLPVAAIVAGIAHSRGFFPDELRKWAADVTTRFLNLDDDVLVPERLRV